VFLSGTSRGAISVVAQNLIATGIVSSSTVTLDLSDALTACGGQAGVPMLQPSYVRRPTQWCGMPRTLRRRLAGRSRAFYDSLVAAGNDASFQHRHRRRARHHLGQRRVARCRRPLAYHGFLGIENTVIGSITGCSTSAWPRSATTRRPRGSTEIRTAAGVPAQIHLSGSRTTADGGRCHTRCHARPPSFGGQRCERPHRHLYARP
jgi:hypothetical protein